MDLELIKIKLDALEQVSSADKERIDMIFESIGSIQGSLELNYDKLVSYNSLFDKINNMEFNESKFTGSLSTIKSRLDNWEDKVFQLEQVANSLMPLLKTLMKKTKFLVYFDNTFSLMQELRNSFEELSLKEKSYRKIDITKLYSDYNALVDKFRSSVAEITLLHNLYLDVNKKQISLLTKINKLVSKLDFISGNKKFYENYISLMDEINLLLLKLKSLHLPDPNYLFINQSLHNYVSLMLEQGYRSDYIISYLKNYGVKEELVKSVLNNIETKL